MLSSASIEDSAVHQFKLLHQRKSGQMLPPKRLRPILREIIDEASLIEKRGNKKDLLMYICLEYIFFVQTEPQLRIVEVKDKAVLHDEDQLKYIFKRHKKKIEVPHQPPIDMDKVVFSNHALVRFIQRFRPHVTLFDARIVAHDILSKATPVTINPVLHVKRMINNNFIEVLYLSNGKHRFVITEKEDHFLVLTVEPNE